MARICIPVCAENVESLVSAAKAASASADLIELRLDCLNRDEFARLPLNHVSKEIQSQLIITLRDPHQGGHRELTRDERIAFWREQLQVPGDSLFDMELDLAKDLAAEGTLKDWSRVICSHHDFDQVPDDIDLIYDQIAKTDAYVIKIAVCAHDVPDCIALFRLIDRARAEDRQIIAIAMGNPGLATRVLGTSRGSFLTFGASDGESATAPGQLTADALRQLYRIEELKRDSPIYGVVGFPAMHSVSPDMHNAAFAHLNIDGVYLPFEVKNVVDFVKRMIHPNTRELEWKVQGLSVTAPHKLTVMQALDSIDHDALEIGAVNTVVVNGDKLLGYNTDAAGFLGPLQKCLGDLRDARVAVIGAGGAANAVAWSLSRAKTNVTVFARDESKASALAARFGVSADKLDGASFSTFDILVNTTPLGTHGQDVDSSPASVDQLRHISLVYDLVYNPIETLLLTQAREAGCKTLTGLQMLVAQAILQFQLWTRETAPSEVMEAAALAALTSK